MQKEANIFKPKSVSNQHSTVSNQLEVNKLKIFSTASPK